MPAAVPRETAPAPDDKPFFLRGRTWLVLTAVVLLVAVAGFLPVTGDAAEGLDPVQVRMGLGIFVCIAFLWITETLPLAVTALLVPLLCASFGIREPDAAFAPFAHPLIFLFLGGFALAAALTHQGLDRWFAQKVVGLGKGNFMAVSALLFGGTAFLSMWMSNTATVAMMLPLALGLARKLPQNVDTQRNVMFLLLGLAYSASIGGLGTIVGSPPNGIAAAALGVGFFEWIRFGAPTVVVSLAAMHALLYVIFRPVKSLRLENEETDFTFNRPRIATLAIFGTIAALWIFGGPLATRLNLGSAYDPMVAVVAIVLVTLFRVVGWKEIERATDWGVLLLFGGGLALSAVLKDTGASLFLARFLGDLIENWPLLLMIAGVIAFVIFMTELASNTATAALFVPIFFSIGSELDLAPAALVIPLALAASCAFMLPVATPPNALVFGTGQIPQREMMRAGLVLNLAFIPLLTLLAQFLL